MSLSVFSGLYKKQ